MFMTPTSTQTALLTKLYLILKRAGVLCQHLNIQRLDSLPLNLIFHYFLQIFSILLLLQKQTFERIK